MIDEALKNPTDQVSSDTREAVSPQQVDPKRDQSGEQQQNMNSHQQPHPTAIISSYASQKFQSSNLIGPSPPNNGPFRSHGIGARPIQPLNPAVSISNHNINGQREIYLNRHTRPNFDVSRAKSEQNLDDILVKMLVPAYATGSIIGKQGQTITQLQRQTGICIKLSKSKDFYPGTSERIALIQGKSEGSQVKKIVKFIIQKVIEFPIPREMMVQNAERAKQVKIIVPNSTAGLIIGKKGVTIKQIMDTSTAKVQMTQKPDNPTMQPLLERVITICGEKDQLFTAVDMILDKIKDDPQSNSCPNLSYQNVTGLIANANPVGSPYAPVSESQLISAVSGITYASAAVVAHQNQQAAAAHQAQQQSSNGQHGGSHGPGGATALPAHAINLLSGHSALQNLNLTAINPNHPGLPRTNFQIGPGGLTAQPLNHHTNYSLHHLTAALQQATQQQYTPASTINGCPPPHHHAQHLIGVQAQPALSVVPVSSAQNHSHSHHNNHNGNSGQQTPVTRNAGDFQSPVSTASGPNLVQ